MEIDSKIYIAGHNGMVGSAIHRRLMAGGYSNIVTRSLEDLDLTSQAATEQFFAGEKPEYVIDAAAKVGGILANNTYRAEFIYENLAIQNNLIHFSWKYGVKKLLFLGSSCIYPKDAPQPLREEYLLTGPLEYTNEPYAIAKIAGIKMCESYNKQYGCNFISVMPTNLYGPNDNYDLEKSHVLPALIRKMHLGKCLENGDWQAIRQDLDRRPVKGVTGKSSEADILKVLNKFGIQPHPPTPSPAGEGESLSLDSSLVTRHSSLVTVTLWGTGNVYREFLHVDDMADACVFVMEKVGMADGRWQVAGGGPASADTSSDVHFLNVGTGRDLTIRELAELVKEIVGFGGNLRWDAEKPDGTFKKQLDVSRLNGLGWREKIGLAEGIRQVYSKYISEDLLF